MERTKYNVDTNKAKRAYDGIIFDSEAEMKYYRDVICPKITNGEITKAERQKPYVLQPGFTRNGTKVLPITYKADFYIEYSDGRTEVIDIKGMPDAVSKLKRKLFWRVYPDIDYIWLTYIKKYGGWVEYDYAQKLRKEAKRLKNKKEK